MSGPPDTTTPPSSPVPARSGWTRELVGASLLSLLLAIALALPCLPEPHLRLLGHPEIDLSAHIWTYWWSIQADGHALVNTPFHDVQFYVLEPVNLVLFRLFQPLAGLVAAHNLVVVVGWVVAGLGGYALGRTVSRSLLAGYTGLVLLELAPATVNAVADGTGEFAWTGLLALSLASFIRLVRRPTRGGVLLASLCFALTGTACFYYGLFVGIAALVWWIAQPQRGARARWRALAACALAAGVGALLLLPSILAFHAAPMDLPSTRESLFALHYTPAELSEPDLLFFLQERGVQGPFPRLGWWFLATALAVVGLRTGTELRRPAIAVGITGLVMAMGSVGPLGIPLPYHLTNRVLGVLDAGLHQPIHFLTLLILSLVILACRLVTHRPMASLLVLLLAVDLHPSMEWLPVPTTALPRSSALRELRTQQGSVLDLPTILEDHQVDLDREALHQLEHHRPIPRFPVFPTSLVHSDGVRAARASALVRAVASGPPWGERPATGDLSAMGYRWLVLDRERSPTLSPPLQRWLGPPRWRDALVEVYDLDRQPPPDDAPPALRRTEILPAPGEP